MYLPLASNTGCQRRNASTSPPTCTTSSPHHQSYHQKPHQPRPYQPQLSFGRRILPRAVAAPFDRSTTWICCARRKQVCSEVPGHWELLRTLVTTYAAEPLLNTRALMPSTSTVGTASPVSAVSSTLAVGRTRICALVVSFSHQYDESSAPFEPVSSAVTTLRASVTS